MTSQQTLRVARGLNIKRLTPAPAGLAPWTEGSWSRAYARLWARSPVEGVLEAVDQ